MSPIIYGIKNLSAVRCFVFRGEDTVSRERAREAVIAAIEKEDGPCVREPFDPSSAESAALFAQRMLTPSLFAERRVFHFRHAQDLDDEDLDELNSALSGGLEGVYCIIEIEKGKKDAGRVLKKLHIDERLSGKPPAACLMEFEKPRDWDIADWLVANAPLLIGRKIARAEAEYLIERVGNDLDTLHSELQKIDLYLDPAAPVTRAVIDHITGAVRPAMPFELAAALGRRDFPRAMRIIDLLFSATVSMPFVVSVIGRHFWALFRIRKFLAANPDIGRRFAASRGSRNSDQTETGFAIGKAAGLIGDGEERKIYPVLIKSGIMEQAGRFTDEECSAILSWLVDFDTGTKTGRVEPSDEGLRMLCYRIIRARQILEEGAGGR
jgi:DNA polymerase III delta subunit